MFSRKHVLIVLGWLDIGGAEKQALLLAQGLIGRGFKVTVMGFQTGVKVPEWCLENGIDCIFEPFTWSKTTKESLRHLWRLAKKLRSLRPDYLIPYTRRPNVVCGLLWCFTGAGGALWNQRDAGLELTGGRLERLALRLASSIISNSSHASRMLENRYGIPHGTVKVIHNGIPIPTDRLPRDKARKKLELPADAWIACMVANLHRQKDHVTVIKAWAEVVPQLILQGRSGILLLAGRDDGLRADLEKMSASLGLFPEHIRFLGFQPDPDLLWAASDICVFGSHPMHEGCPNGILEAMACGLPVAATDCEGVREVLPFKGENQIVPNGDAAALALKLLHYATHQQIGISQGQKNQLFVEENFSVERMVDQYTYLIQRARKVSVRPTPSGAIVPPV